MSEVGTAAGAPKQPVTISDERVGVNGAVAAALTQGVGSMPALYLTLAFCTGWMVLATWGPLHRVDPYPFGFLLFINNVVQLVLCAVILVGQRVLGLAADRRAVQTYENAEAIFAQVADLQAHLDRHDRVLGRGASLLESSPHPWIRRHRVQPPPQAIDQVVGLNGRIAAWLTQRLGSMGAFYVAAGTQVVWIGLAELGWQTFDPYPFAFMSFLSTFAQLVFMIVIMVGQKVLSLAGDRRSEQTFLDAEAILHECRRMKARLIAQDRVIDSLSDYTAAQVTEHLAQALHQSRMQARADATLELVMRPSVRPWHELPEEQRRAGRRHARMVGESLAAIGCLMFPASDIPEVPEVSGTSEEGATLLAFEEHEAQVLARLEHEHRLSEGSDPYRRGGDPAPWDELSDRARAQAVDAVRYLPTVLADVGFQVVRLGAGADGAGEPDFTPEDWATLRQALTVSGMLVALAEGEVDADEIVAMVQLLREASVSHPRRLVRELAAAADFGSGLRGDVRYADYEKPALHTIRTAATVVARVAPGELAAFRAFLNEIAAVVAEANNEGGFFGLGARPPHPTRSCGDGGGGPRGRRAGRLNGAPGRARSGLRLHSGRDGDPLVLQVLLEVGHDDGGFPLGLVGAREVDDLGARGEDRRVPRRDEVDLAGLGHDLRAVGHTDAHLALDDVAHVRGLALVVLPALEQEGAVPVDGVTLEADGPAVLVLLVRLEHARYPHVSRSGCFRCLRHGSASLAAVRLTPDGRVSAVTPPSSVRRCPTARVGPSSPCERRTNDPESTGALRANRGLMPVSALAPFRGGRGRVRRTRAGDAARTWCSAGWRVLAGELVRRSVPVVVAPARRGADVDDVAGGGPRPPAVGQLVPARVAVDPLSVHLAHDPDGLAVGQRADHLGIPRRGVADQQAGVGDDPPLVQVVVVMVVVPHHHGGLGLRGRRRLRDGGRGGAPCGQRGQRAGGRDGGDLAKRRLQKHL